MEDDEYISRKRQKRCTWTIDDETILIQIWKEKKDELKKVRKNSHIIENMARELLNYGIEVTDSEIKTKMHNMKNKYRAEKLKIEALGGISSDWRFFPEIDEIVGPYNFKKSDDAHEKTNTSASPFADLNNSCSYDFEGVASTSSVASRLSPVSTKSSIVASSRRRKNLISTTNQKILDEIQKSNKHTEKYLKKMQEMDRIQISNDSILIKLEKERNEILKKISQDNESFNNKLLDKL